MGDKPCTVCNEDYWNEEFPGDEEFADAIEIGTCGDCGTEGVCIICWQHRDCCTKVVADGVHL